MYYFAYGVKIHSRPPHYFPTYSVFLSISLSSPWLYLLLLRFLYFLFFFDFIVLAKSLVQEKLAHKPFFLLRWIHIRSFRISMAE